MKNQNAKEQGEKFKNCPVQKKEYEIDGQKYIVFSHFTGKKDLDNVIYTNACNQAMNEMLHA